MPTVKGSYEAVFIFSLTLGEEGVAEIKEKFKSLIEQNAEIGEIDEWGKRRLAYLINDEADGFYVLYNFARNSRLSSTVSARSPTACFAR